MEVCGVRCRGLRVERRQLRAASSTPAQAPRALLRCCAAAAPETGGHSAALGNSAASSRRLVLSAAAAATVLRATRSSADEEEEPWSRYTRAFRERFETSISSATRAYSFEYPASWGPGARHERAAPRFPV